jgi:hypothetical protein
MDRDEMSILYRGPSIDASYQVSVHLVEGFQRRRLKCEKLTDDGCQVMAKAHIAFGKGELKSWDPELELITRYFQMLEFLILKTESTNLDLITYTNFFMARVLNIRDTISIKREIYIITQQGVNIIILWCQM